MATDTSNFNFQGIGVVTDSAIIGCTDPLAINFDPLANQDDGSCITAIPGCMNPAACNYDAAAGVNQDDGSCEYCSCSNNTGCKSPTACNYNPFADCDDGSCSGLAGCTDATACNYDPLATCGDGNCVGLLGCMDATASNYDSNATCDDGSCIACVYGCTDPADFNYDPLATCDDGTCIASIYGCTDPAASGGNNLGSANIDDGSCTYTIFGCTDPTAYNYDPTATIDDATCDYLGCTDPIACNYDAGANVDDSSCILPAGCNDPLYLEYDPLVTYCPDNTNACITLIVNGCTDPTATNYNAAANVDDSSCTYPVPGCMDPTACNYNSAATVSDGSCTQPAANTNCAGNCLSGFSDFGAGCVAIVTGCTDPLACNYDASANVDDSSCNTVYGCMDNTTPAANYNSLATCDDGSCLYCDTATISVDITNIAQNTGTGGQATPANGSAEITPSTTAEDTPYTYTFSDSVGNTIFTTSTSGTTTTISGLNAGTYTVNITTAHGCTSTSSFVITNNITQYVLGCTNPLACNYNAAATYNDGSCLFGTSGCTDCGTLWEGQGIENATSPHSWQFCDGVSFASNLGATNYTPGATCDDGSCDYGCPAKIGGIYHGGIVFWVSDPTDPNCTGYAAATGDYGGSWEWGCYNTSISGADGIAIGTGHQNTLDINAGCSCGGATALCPAAHFGVGGNYSNHNNYHDWFLPSALELNAMYHNIGPGNALGLGNVGNFPSGLGLYWSSTEMSSTHAAFQNFNTGVSSVLTPTHLGHLKNAVGMKIRPIRFFDAANDCIPCSPTTGMYNTLGTIGGCGGIPQSYPCAAPTS